MTGTVDGLITGETSFGALGQELSGGLGVLVLFSSAVSCLLARPSSAGSLLLLQGGLSAEFPERVKRQSRRAWLGVASKYGGSWFLLALGVAYASSGRPFE